MPRTIQFIIMFIVDKYQFIESSEYVWNLVRVYHPVLFELTDNYEWEPPHSRVIRDDTEIEYDSLADEDLYIADEVFGKRLLVSKNADQKELHDNIRVARVILSTFADTTIIINRHVFAIGHKNPEYTINDHLSDRKGVESENGIKASFRKAKKHRSKAVIVSRDVYLAKDKEEIRQVLDDIIKQLEA